MSGYGPPRGWRGSNAWSTASPQRTEEAMKFNDEAVEQVGRLFKENAELRKQVEDALAERDEWHRQNGLLRGERDAATARAEQAEARAQYLDEEALRLQRTIDEARKQRDDWHDEATRQRTRAEKAEAALAEMRERLGNAEVEWAARWRESNGEEVYRSSSTEADARHFVRLWRERGLPGYVTGLEVVSALIGEWQNAEAPRTVSERAADEQGDGEGGDA